ncbi:lipopolysaccharide biosynthesis protein [Chryseobacterium sp. OSA05B]|uniref:lipopolysaccharide biosynthesis protein n=1 Tax=Chryseobacterium sp. OSA05B TaxID=2862650 RepID=UPI001CBA8654|nr:oligosaccharide flippase family protein [Chryseobacterium sp. OSA05B]
MSFRNIISRIQSNTFFKNVAILASGTIISQAIVVASSPLLSRLYSVEAFGLLSLFTSYMVISAVVSTGRYELAVGLPEKDTDAKKLFQLILYIGFFISAIYLGIITLLKELLGQHVDLQIFKYWWIYLAPIYIFFIAVFSGALYWLQRKKKYKKITIANAIQVIFTALCSIVFGLFHRTEGMILSLILGTIISSLYIVVSEKDLKKDLFVFTDIKSVAKQYSSFPRYMLFSDLSLTASQQFIPILFSALYSTTVVGFFSMANRMLRLPNIVITTAIGNVFRNDAIDEIRKNGNCENLYKSTFKKLVAMSFPIYLFLFIVSPYLFVIVFGQKWYDAGIFARILSVLLLVEFISTPLNVLFNIREKQKILMRLQFLNAVAGGIMIFLGFKVFNNASVSLILFTLNSLLFNIIFLVLSYRIAKQKTFNFN